MTDWTPEEEEAFNMVENNSNLGKQILRAEQTNLVVWTVAHTIVFKAETALLEPER